jgi:uncharacterized protein YlxW (UPF0749 family)
MDMDVGTIPPACVASRLPRVVASLTRETRSPGFRESTRARAPRSSHATSSLAAAARTLVSYSDSLAAVAEAGKNGKKTMGKVTSALNDLAGVVGAIPLAGAGLTIVNAVGAK